MIMKAREFRTNFVPCRRLLLGYSIHLSPSISLKQ